MRYYRIYFSDCTDTIGKAATAAEIRREARQYIKAWGLDCSVERIEEITPEEYNRNRRA